MLSGGTGVGVSGAVVAVWLTQVEFTRPVVPTVLVPIV